MATGWKEDVEAKGAGVVRLRRGKKKGMVKRKTEHMKDAAVAGKAEGRRKHREAEATTEAA